MPQTQQNTTPVQVFSEQRKYLPIATVSMLGECETKFVKAITGQLYPTKAMQQGTKLHEKLTEGLPKITKAEIQGSMRVGSKGSIREIFVTDEKFKLRGRIDQLDLLGKLSDGRSEAIIIDDKFTRMHYESIPLQYKLQLAAYSSAIHNSTDYSGMCRIVGARLVCRDRGDKHVFNEFDVKRGELESWESNIVLASKVAWVLYRKERQPGHRRLDIGNGEWNRCECGR